MVGSCQHNLDDVHNKHSMKGAKDPETFYRHKELQYNMSNAACIPGSIL